MKPYTKEPWYLQWADNGMLRIVEQSDEAAIIADVNVEGQEITGRPEEEGIANGRRIVACVNACKDISDPEFEIAQLLQYKANLLKALGETFPRDALETYRNPDNIPQETPKPPSPRLGRSRE